MRRNSNGIFHIFAFPSAPVDRPKQRRQQNNFVGGTTASSSFGFSAICRGMGAMMCCPDENSRRVYDETSDRVGLAGAMEKIQAERVQKILINYFNY